MQGYPDRARKQGGGAALPMRGAPPTYPKNRDGQFSPPVPAKRVAERAGSMLASDASAAYTKDKRFAGWSTGEENSKWEKPSLGVLGWRFNPGLCRTGFVLKCRVLHRNDEGVVSHSCGLLGSFPQTQPAGPDGGGHSYPLFIHPWAIGGLPTLTCTLLA